MTEQKETKQVAAFEARIGNYFKDLFNETLEKSKDHEGNIPRGAKKNLLEKMIMSYVIDEKNKTKEEALTLESEINLIAENLNNILAIFKNIRSKAQDTIIIERESGKQSVVNLTTELDTANAKIKVLEEENIQLKTSNDAFNDVKENLTLQIEKLRSELDTEKTTRLELEKEFKGLKNVEKLNTSLEKELENTKNQLNSVKNISIDKDSKISSLENKLKSSNDELSELDLRKSKEILELKNKLNTTVQEIEDRIKREAGIDIKQASLNADMKINDMQLKLIETIKELNTKNSEIEELKKKLSSYDKSHNK